MCKLCDGMYVCVYDRILGSHHKDSRPFCLQGTNTTLFKKYIQANEHVILDRVVTGIIGKEFSSF